MFFGTRKKPRGPLGPKDKYLFDLSGTKLSLETPPQNHELIEGTKPGKQTLDIYKKSNFDRFNKNDKDEPSALGLLHKDWEFYGVPLVDGVIGSLKCSSSVYFFEGFSSLFRPRRFESATDRYVYNGGAESTRHPGETRLNWRVVDLEGHKWANYEVNCPPGINNAEEVRLSIWQLPIAEEHIITFYFRQIFRKNVPALRNVFKTTIDGVMESIHLELSETSAAQKKAAETQFPWEKLSESRPPYDFEKHEKLDDYHMFCQVDDEFGSDLTYEEKDRETKKRLKNQKKLIRETKEAILASHLRFEALELEDRKRHEANMAKKAS